MFSPSCSLHLRWKQVLQREFALTEEESVHSESTNNRVVKRLALAFPKLLERDEAACNLFKISFYVIEL